MANKSSAGLLMYRLGSAGLEVLLGHPGGPYWRRRDLGAWTIPKGLVQEGEEPQETAIREFAEETGIQINNPNRLVPLSPIIQKGGKTVHAWAFEGDCIPELCRSNMVVIERPYGSGRYLTFPELDCVASFPVQVARRKINQAQCALLDQLDALVG